MDSSSTISGSIQFSAAISMLEVANKISQQIALLTAQSVEDTSAAAELGSSFGLGLKFNVYA